MEALTDTLKQQAKGMEHLLMRQKQGSSHLEVQMSIVPTEMRFFSQHLLNRYYDTCKAVSLKLGHLQTQPPTPAKCSKYFCNKPCTQRTSSVKSHGPQQSMSNLQAGSADAPSPSLPDFNFISTHCPQQTGFKNGPSKTQQTCPHSIKKKNTLN